MCFYVIFSNAFLSIKKLLTKSKLTFLKYQRYKILYRKINKHETFKTFFYYKFAHNL